MTKTNHIKTLFAASILSLGMMTSCSDDLGLDRWIDSNSREGVVEIKFSVSENTRLLTRGNDDGNERFLNDMAILVFGENDILVQREDLAADDFKGYKASSSGSRNFDYTLVYNDEAKAADSPRVIAVANSKSITSDRSDILADFSVGSGKTFSDLQKLESTYYKDHFGDDVNTAGAFIMSGQLAHNNEIKLNRSAAKITLRDAKNPNTETDPSKDFDFYLKEDTEENGHSVYDVYNTAEKCFVIAPLLNTPYCKGNDKEKERSTRIKNNGYRYDSYAAPTKTYTGADVFTYVVFKGVYKDKEGYYALILADEKGDYYNIEPNHWYEITLSKVSIAGYATPEEAMKNPFMPSSEDEKEGDVIASIHDHAPDILSIISDGVHELGVTPSVQLLAEGGTAKDQTGYFIVKCYSNDGSAFDPSELHIIYDKENGWFEIDEGKVYDESDEDFRGEETPNEKDTPGNQYKFTVTVTRELYSDRNATVKVRWKGLEREVAIIFDSTRPLSELCSATLTIIPETGENSVITDYWKFIAGEGVTNLKDNSDSPDRIPKLWGIGEDAMGPERERTMGFHFPMPYGDNKNWEYEYKLVFSGELQNQIPQDQYHLDYVKPTDPFFRKYLDCTVNQEERTATLKLKEEGKGLYDYAVGKIQFLVTGNGITYYLNFDLYHTGFFHYENSKAYGFDDGNSDIAENGGYYYYEVIEMEGLHWLDRNLGAKSNRSFVKYEDDTSIGEPKAAGKYYTIANVVSNYSEPDIVEAMCPPGYRIPTTSDWNGLRLSSNFRNQQSLLGENSYISTYYETGKEEIGDVYFQKGGFYSSPNSYNTLSVNVDEVYNGDGASGYYWTKTEAPGMEKEHIGNWLRALYINGGSTNFNNASVRDHKLMVRCVAKGEGLNEEDIVNHYISFNVHNVTHVLLFTYNEDESGNVLSSPLYTFPGKAVGSSASAVKWQNFSCITSADMGNMYAIFCKENKDGTVTVFIKDPDNENIRFTKAKQYDSSLLTPEYAWSIWDGEYYDFCETAKTRTNTEHTDKDNNVWESIPNGCNTDYPDEDRTDPDKPVGGGSGTVTRFDPELDYEQTVWEGSYYTGDDWQHKLKDMDINDLFNWDDVPVGSTIKFYVKYEVLNNNYFQVTTPDPDWKEILGASNQNFTEGVLTFELTQDVLNKILSKGFWIQGKNCILSRITITVGSGGTDEPGGSHDPSLPEHPTEYNGDPIIYSETFNDTFTWNGLQKNILNDRELCKKIPEGAKLIMDISTYDNYWKMQVFNGDWKPVNGMKEDYENSKDPSPLVIPLTCQILDQMIKYGGFYIQGNFILNKITIEYNP